MSQEFNASFSMLGRDPGLQLLLTAISPVLLFACAGCSSNVEKPAPPPPAVTITQVVQKDVPITQEWVGTMVGNTDSNVRPKVEWFLLSRRGSPSAMPDTIGHQWVY